MHGMAKESGAFYRYVMCNTVEKTKLQVGRMV